MVVFVVVVVVFLGSVLYKATITKCGTNLLFGLTIVATTIFARVLGYAIAKYVQICIPIQLLFDTLISYTFSKLFLLSSKMT